MTSLQRLKLALLSTLILQSAAAGVRADDTMADDTKSVTAAQLGPYRPQFQAQRDGVRAEIMKQTNARRRQSGRDPVSSDDELTAIAQQFAEFMATHDLYGHQADERTPSQRADAAEFKYCQLSENIALHFRSNGYSSLALAKVAAEGWWNSPDHRRNLLAEHVTVIGVGVEQSRATGAYYLVQLFARPAALRFEFRVVNESEQDVRYRWGEQSFALSPGMGRVHTGCLPMALKLADGGSESAQVPTPAGGETWTIRPTDAGPRLHCEEKQAPPNHD